MKIISSYTPSKLVIGNHCFNTFIEDIIQSNIRILALIVDPHVTEPLDLLLSAFHRSGIKTIVTADIESEPSIKDFQAILKSVQKTKIEAVVGLGGGSVLDVAKLVAVLYDSKESIFDVVGIGKVTSRNLPLYCIPTTAGTGSEVSPNAILLDGSQNLKVGVISPFLVPDASYIDPVLTYTVPYHVTAATGIDALTHCLEAYVNKHAHPVIDLYALEGIRLIYENLESACENNPDARAKVALGSLYGGMCLGPVNTGAVHALAYPLGSEYKVAHGISNALLLPHVIEANLPFGADKYERIALTIGAHDTGNTMETARSGIALLKELCVKIGIPQTLTALNITKDKVPQMAKSAMKVKRLLKNNPRDFTEHEVMDIYYRLFEN